MARKCEFTGTSPLTGNNVSHAQNKTKRRFKPNLCMVRLQSDALEQSFRFKISAKALRSVDHAGGLDAFLTKAHRDQLSDNAKKVQKRIIDAFAA